MPRSNIVSYPPRSNNGLSLSNTAAEHILTFFKCKIIPNFIAETTGPSYQTNFPSKTFLDNFSIRFERDYSMKSEIIPNYRAFDNIFYSLRHISCTVSSECSYWVAVEFSNCSLVFATLFILMID